MNIDYAARFVSISARAFTVYRPGEHQRPEWKLLRDIITGCTALTNNPSRAVALEHHARAQQIEQQAAQLRNDPSLGDDEQRREINNIVIQYLEAIEELSNEQP